MKSRGVNDSYVIQGLDCCAWFGLVLVSLLGVVLVVCNRPPPEPRSDPDVEAGRLVRLTRTWDTEQNPAWSPKGDKIAFECSDDGELRRDGPGFLELGTAFLPGPIGICVMNADGTGFQRLTSGGFDPSWSPDGSKIAFSGGTMNGDGSGFMRINFDDFRINDPLWSPDGNKIAFWTRRDGQSDIYVMNPDGSELAQITDTPRSEYHPAWSPDGQRIAFTTREDDCLSMWPFNRDCTAIFLVNRDGSGKQLVYLTDELEHVQSLAWSPDGEWIAFDAEVNESGWRNKEIFAIKVSELTNWRETARLQLTHRERWDMSPSWSPDGRKIVFSSDRTGNPEIYIMEFNR